MIEIVSTETWKPEFFTMFTGFANSLYLGNPYRLNERNSALHEQFAETAPFATHNSWMAMMAIKNGKPLARLIVSARKAQSMPDFAPCGYFESVDDPVPAKLLFDLAESWARKLGFKQLRGPIQGNFFNSFRMKLPGGREPFYGEPVYHDYYHRLFQDGGFSVSGHWKTMVISRQQSAKTMWQIVKKFHSHSAGTLKLRLIDLNRWEDELKLIYEMVMESYTKMPDFMPISFEEFKVNQNPFRHVVNRRAVFFVEHGGTPVAFMVGVFDPLKILLWQQKKGMIRGRLRDLATLLLLKFNFRSKMLILYTGKVEKPGQPFKGVLGLMSKQITANTLRYGTKEGLACFLAEGSPAYNTLPQDMEPYAEYVLYQRDIRG